MQTHSNTGTPSNQDHLYFHQQQQQQQQQLFQQAQYQSSQQFESLVQSQQLQAPQNQQFQSLQHQQFLPPPQQQQQQQQSLVSHFELFDFVEKLAETIENGTRDQQTDALINDLSNHFEKCQQLLNSVSGSINSKPVTVEGHKQKVEETEELLNQRRHLVNNKYRNSVVELVKSKP